MVNNKAIRDRFMLCLNEIDSTLDEIAHSIDSNKSYLSQLKTKDNSEIKAVLIARFCHVYGYSPHYILLGEGAKKAKGPKTREDKLIDIIGDMMDAMLELKPKWNSTQKELATRAKKATQ
jgi:hypothetical protein